jgi:hypothetical protein
LGIILPQAFAPAMALILKRFFDNFRSPFIVFSHGKSSRELLPPVSVVSRFVDNGSAHRDSRGDPLKTS